MRGVRRLHLRGFAVAPLKRLSLLVEALATPAAAGVRCVIAGKGRALVPSTCDRHSRTIVTGDIDRPLDERQLLEHLSRCRAVCFPPFDKIWIRHRRGVRIAQTGDHMTDSGGPAELVMDDVNGKVCAHGRNASVALRELMETPSLAERLGETGLQLVSEMTWPRAVRRLLAPVS